MTALEAHARRAELAQIILADFGAVVAIANTILDGNLTDSIRADFLSSDLGAEVLTAAEAMASDAIRAFATFEARDAEPLPAPHNLHDQLRYNAHRMDEEVEAALGCPGVHESYLNALLSEVDPAAVAALKRIPVSPQRKPPSAQWLIEAVRRHDLGLPALPTPSSYCRRSAAVRPQRIATPRRKRHARRRAAQSAARQGPDPPDPDPEPDKNISDGETGPRLFPNRRP